jgi:hypothetical protein
MKRFLTTVAALAIPAVGLSTVAATSVAGAGSAGAATITTTTCTVSKSFAPYPVSPETFNVKLGSAGIGTVTVAANGPGLIKVTSVTHAAGYSSFVDSKSGSSIDVYFTGGGHRVKFEAEVRDRGNLLLTTRVC